MSNLIEKISLRLQNLSPHLVNIKDESHLHAHHAEGKSGAHLRLHIVSEQFNNLKTLPRHRLIYKTLGDLSALGIHALSICALTPQEKKSNF